MEKNVKNVFYININNKIKLNLFLNNIRIIY